jgi:hypothetical protein
MERWFFSAGWPPLEALEVDKGAVPDDCEPENDLVPVDDPPPG